MSFVIVVTIENGIELGSNFQIRNTMTSIIKVSTNRFVCIVACDSTTMLTKFCPQRSSSFSNIKHAIATSIVHPTRERLIRCTTIPGVGCYGVGCYAFLMRRKILRDYWRNWFQDVKILPSDIANMCQYVTLVTGLLKLKLHELMAWIMCIITSYAMHIWSFVR